VEKGLELIRRGIASGALDARVALECFLLVKLGLRKVAIVTIPAELPDGAVLGAEVDYEYQARFAGRSSDLKTRFKDTVERKRLDPVSFKTYLLRSSFVEKVLTSPSYLAHKAIAVALGLEVLESEVRPTIREWYICQPADVPTVRNLLERRFAIQTQARKAFKRGDPIEYYVYPEERDADYLRSLGALLGYPSCCVEAYAEGRLAPACGDSVIPEERAARQLKGRGPDTDAGPVAEGSLEVGVGLEAGAATFWLKDFFPCRPGCPEAVAKGKGAFAAIQALDADLAQRYSDLCRENLTRVEHGPETTRAHADWLAKR
jgi:hypothetical protein